MELINLLLNSVTSEICFLCFKKCSTTEDVHCEFELESKLFKESLSLANIIRYLFPSFELTLNKVCSDCSDLMIRMYVAINKNIIMKRIIKMIIDNFDKEIDNINNTSLDKLSMHSININLFSIINASRQCELNNIIVDKNTHEKRLSNLCDKDDLNTIQQCHHCYKLFKSVKKLKIHLRNHSQKRKLKYHKCNHCNYKSVCKESLNGHINKNHLKTRPFVCKICYRSFYHKKNLVEHEIRHEQVRNSMCDVCGDRFVYRKNLIEHLKLHSGEKSYECDVCGKRYITSGRRSEHIKRCHTEKDLNCLLCERKFSLTKELTRHMKTVHK